MSNILFHSPVGAKSDELFTLLKEEFLQAERELKTDQEQDTLIIAFPDNFKFANSQKTINEILTNSLFQIQKFVQMRIKKKFGQILCLINAEANGLSYSQEIDSCFASAQGGFAGIIKTITKEYSKRGIIGNVLYIDWQSVNLPEIIKLIKCLLGEHSQLKGQVFAIDGGKWL